MERGDWVEFYDNGEWRIAVYEGATNGQHRVFDGKAPQFYESARPIDRRSVPTWLAAARQFGGEAIANDERRSAPNREDKESIAYYHPTKDWQEMSAADQQLARGAFMAGARMEEEHHTRIRRPNIRR